VLPKPKTDHTNTDLIHLKPPDRGQDARRSCHVCEISSPARIVLR